MPYLQRFYSGQSHRIAQEMAESLPLVLWEVLVFFCNQISSGSKDATSSLPVTIKNAARSPSADADCASASCTD